MAEVYPAYDTQLERKVALKLLPGALADDGQELDLRSVAIQRQRRYSPFETLRDDARYADLMRRMNLSH